MQFYSFSGSLSSSQALLSLNTCITVDRKRRIEMSRTQKEKLKIFTDTSLQLLPEDDEEGADIEAESCIEISLEERKKEANKPLYLKRI